jgi:predicted acetyltransferase
MIPVRVSSPEHLETMRVLRNESRSFFVNDTSEISSGTQNEWWRTNSRNVVAFVFYDSEPLGYCMVFKRSDGKWWDSIAVSEKHRGNGLGRKFLKYVLGSVRFDVWSKVRTDNRPCVGIHSGDDWEMVGKEGDLLIFHTWKGR